MTLRKVVFWIHLASGLLAGVVIAIMSATGIAIAFEEEILAAIDAEVSHVAAPAPGARPLPVADLQAMVTAARPGFLPTAVVIPEATDRAYEFYAGRDGPLYVDPYSGAMQESRAHDAHEFIHTLEEWHRWLGRPDGITSTGRLVTGVCNLAFLVLCLTGLWLWFPRKWSWRAFRPLLGLVGNFRGKARDFNWHMVFGFWSLPVLVVLVATGVVISFEWGHRIPFILAGEEPPKSRNYGMMAVPPAVVPTPAPGARFVSAETLLERAAAEFPAWETVRLPLVSSETSAPGGVKPLAAGVTVPDAMPSRAYVPVEMDPFTGNILQATRFDDRSPGLRARVWMRFLHTGGAFGLPGKIVATLATAASLILVYTGFALSWRRFFRRRVTSLKPGAQPS